ncbi:MAG: acyl carrier protein [Helicobacteraceae bacterium]|jgi:acyl carrier protein|nr:acyl carrier protein [Helicobacteraceae bacterium]
MVDNLEGKIKEILEKVLDMPIDPSTAAQGVTPNWDELRHLEIIMEIEDRLGVMFNHEESAQLTSFKAILEKLQKELK